MTATTIDLRAIAHAVISANGRHDATALGALHAADATLVFPGATFNGREEIIAMRRGWFTTARDRVVQASLKLVLEPIFRRIFARVRLRRNPRSAGIAPQCRSAGHPYRVRQ